MLSKLLTSLLTCLALCPSLLAHVGHHPSVHDTVASIIERIRRSPHAEQIRSWKAEGIEAFLTPKEKHVLATEHITFDVDIPVLVSVLRTKSPAEDLFWLRDGWTRSDLQWHENNELLTIHQRAFPPGTVGLGVNSLTGGGNHYLVLLQPQAGSGPVDIRNLYPGQLRLSTLTNGVRPYVDHSFTLSNIPSSLLGQTILQTQHNRRDAAKLVDIFRITDHKSSTSPDQIILTWSSDPRTTQTIQWRTSTNVKRGKVVYARKADASLLRARKAQAKSVTATTERIVSTNTLNDPSIHRHTVTLTALEPGTTYIYSVGDGHNNWSEELEFTTAPAGVEPFAFVYMGDAQNGLDRWGSLLKNAYRNRPDASFYIMAGDLVNRGADRDDWDSFFHNAKGVYDRRQLVPVIGNHECQGGHPSLYLQLFHLPTNGPANLEKERAYYFEYSNALFVVLDSNLPPASQTNWLEQVLSQTKATWKFVTYHHPAYSSAPNRDNKEIRNLWTEIFDRHHVDMALQGHDHAYLRTYPMHGQKPVDDPNQGTVYVVSVSGTKYYGLAARDYTAFGMANTSTYQLLDIQIAGDRLIYRAYDDLGKLRDELVIDKSKKK